MDGSPDGVRRWRRRVAFALAGVAGLALVAFVAVFVVGLGPGTATHDGTLAAEYDFEATYDGASDDVVVTYEGGPDVTLERVRALVVEVRDADSGAVSRVTWIADDQWAHGDALGDPPVTVGDAVRIDAATLRSLGQSSGFDDGDAIALTFHRDDGVTESLPLGTLSGGTVDRSG